MDNSVVRPLISVVAPAYRCADCLVELHRRLVLALRPLSENFEILLVDDASPDSDWERIQSLAAQDPRVKGIRLSRNFGQHHAITAGVDFAQGDWIVVMDADLQDRPEEIPNLYRIATSQEWDIVFGRRINRHDPVRKKLLSRAFSVVLNTLSDIRIDPAIANFSIASRQVIESYRRLRESSRSYGLGLLWCGYRVGYLDIQHGTRYAGESAYSLGRSMHLALESITSLSNKPLRLAINLGFAMSVLAFFYGAYLVLRFMFWAIPVAGWTSTIVSMFFLSGIILAFLGILGLYLGKVFDETKHRPIYLVREALNLDHRES